MIRRLLAAVVACAIFAGCAQTGAAPAATLQASTQAQSAGEVTVSGRVAEVVPGARMIVMAETVDGVALIVLATGGKVYAADGDEVALTEIRPGLSFSAAGSIVSSDSLLADAIHLRGGEEPEPSEGPAETLPSAVAATPALSEPVSAAQAISLEDPSFGEMIASPVEIRGQIARVPTGRTVRVRVFDSQGNQIGESALEVSGEPGQPGSFAGHVPFDAPAVGGGTVEAAGANSDSGSEASVRVQVGFDGTPSIVLSGVVGAFYADPPLIVLEETVHGFSSVRLADETVITFLNGAVSSPSDIRPGKAIWASGFGGESGTLIAHEIVLIEDGVEQPVAAVHEIEIEAPADGETPANPIELRGRVSHVPFEGTLVARLWDAAGELVAEHAFIVDGLMGEPAGFVTHIEYWVEESGTARLEVVEISPRDGGTVASAEVGIVLASTPDTVIVGRIASVFASARIIDLGAPVEGIELVAIDDLTVILSADGDQIGLEDLALGAEIEISGRPGAPGTLIASQIRVLS